jgi:protein tyrosine phosphatase (PTP) superfamily phosphohydrolase (DUF442 family)
MSTSEITSITNYLEINPKLGTAGMPERPQFYTIAEHSFQVVINLALDESPGAIPDEADLVNTLGMKYIHIPVIWESPNILDLEWFFSAMQNFSESSIFVHCVLNMRVSVFVYLYRVKILNESPENAFRDVLKIWQPDPTWQSLIDSALSNHIR